MKLLLTAAISDLIVLGKRSFEEKKRKLWFTPGFHLQPTLLPGVGGNSWRCCCESLLSACRYRPAPSACLQISHRDVICLAPWLNAHLLALSPHLPCVCKCVCVCSVYCDCVNMTPPVSSQLEWRLLLYLQHCNYRLTRTQNDRRILTARTRYFGNVLNLRIKMDWKAQMEEVGLIKVPNRRNRKDWIKHGQETCNRF